MRQRTTRTALLAILCIVLTLPAAAQEGSGSDASSIATLTAKLERALEAGNLEGALYRYDAVQKATGQEDMSLLGNIGRLVLLRDLRAGRGWLAVNAAQVLAQGGDAEALELLQRFAGGTEQPVNLRIGALIALAELGRPDAESLRVARQAADDNQRPMMERLTALDALLAMRDSSAVQSLSLVLRSAEQHSRIQAARILRDRSVPAMDTLRQAAQDQDAEIRLLALEGLVKLRDPEAIRILSEELGTGEVEILAVTPKNKELQEGERASRYNFQQFNRDLRLARALLPSRDRAAIRFMAEAALHPDVVMNQALLAAELARVSPAPGEQVLRELMVVGSPTERLDAAAALARRGHASEAVPVLAEIYRASMSEEDEAIRLSVAMALGEIDMPGARLLLREVAQRDTFDLARQRAARDLAMAGDPLGLQVLREILDFADRLLGNSTAVALVEVARHGDPAAMQAAGR